MAHVGTFSYVIISRAGRMSPITSPKRVYIIECKGIYNVTFVTQICLSNSREALSHVILFPLYNSTLSHCAGIGFHHSAKVVQ